MSERTRAVLSVVTSEKVTYEFDGRLTGDEIREALITGEHHPVESDIRSEDIDVLSVETFETPPCDCGGGALWPIASDGDDSFPFVERCDDCKVFADDIIAANAVAATLEGGRVVMEPVHGDPTRPQPAVYPHPRWS